MTASVAYLQHVLTPQKRRIEHVQPRSIRSLAPDWQRPFIALHNGRAILRRDWDVTLHHGETLAFVDVEAIPQGGGGDGGSNPIRIILMIVVMVYAPYLANYAMTGNFAAIGAGASFGLQAAGFAAQMVGMMLVNALIPPPKLPTPQQAASLAAPSPTYSLQAQGNLVRLEAAIPEHFGRHVAYPDFAAQPYQEFAGNEQYLYQLLCIGRGEYDIEAIRIEDTPISSFDEITYELIPPNGTLTLFPANVITSPEVSGQELFCVAGTYSQSGTVVTVTQTGHGLATGKNVYLDVTSGATPSGTYAVTGAPTPDTFTVTAASAATSGNVNVSPWVGAFVASAPETTANYLGLDFALPRGLYYANDSGALSTVSIQAAIESRLIDDAGAPVGAWVALSSPSYSAATTTPQRYSARVAGTVGRYEVRARRVDVKQTDTRYGHDLAWAGLRAYLPDTRTFGDVTLMALRMRASNNLSMQASRKVNVIATRKIPAWNGTSWSANTATRSPAWALAYACKQVGLTDAQIDLATLLQLDATWAARGDHFDARFDNFLSFWEAVAKIAAAGRAKPYMQGGVMRVMRDQAATLPVQLYSMRNIVKGSFSVDYLMPTVDTADAIDVGYFDSGSWAQRRVRAKLPGSTAARPAKVELFGVTGREHAFREGMYQAAANRYRRKLIKFSTEMEGFIPSFGDLIAIQHDMPAWGQGGEIVSWDAGTFTATLSEPPEWAESGTHYLALRERDGGVAGPYAVSPSVRATNLQIWSEQFDHAAWTEYNATLTPNATTAPDGTATADLLETTATYGHIQGTYFSAQGATVLSVYAKASGSGFFQLNDVGSSGAYGQFDLTTGTVTGQGLGGVASIEPAANGFFRCSVAFTNSTGSLIFAIGYHPSIATSAYVWGAQVEAATELGPYVSTLGAPASTYWDDRVTLSGWVPGVDPTPYSGGTEERTHYAFGVAETYRQPARVIAVRPRGLHSVDIECINEDANVHTAEIGAVAPALQHSQLVGYTNAPVILGLSTRSMPADPTVMLITWQPSPWADYYVIEQSSDGQTWTRTGETSTSNYTATALYGNATIIRVAAVGVAKGPWVQVSYGNSADYMWNATDTTAMWNATDTTLMWSY